MVKAALLPPAGPLLVYAVGLLLARWRRRTGRWLRHGAVATLYLLSTGTGAWLLAHPLEALEPPLQAATSTSAQAIVVLSASSVRNNPEYGHRSVPDFLTIERINYAALLARQTGLPMLVTGGVLSDKRGEDALATMMQRVFEEHYGLAVRWREMASQTTAENAVFSARMLKADGVQRILLVTDAMHMRRARAAFERSGLQVTPAPTMFVATRAALPWDLVPSAENLRRSHYALYEWLGLALYRVHPGRD